MSKQLYDMPLSTAIQKFTLTELVHAFSSTHPAFFAAVMRAATRMKQQ